MEIAIIDSGIAHQHASGGYKIRRQECAQAAQLLNIDYLAHLPGERFKDVDLLASPLNQRVRHVISENQRVLKMVEAIKNKSFSQMGEILYESHASLKDDYQVSVAEIDFMVELSKHKEGVIGARLTGGGFGGCMILFTHRGQAFKAASDIIKTASLELSFSPRLVEIIN